MWPLRGRAVIAGCVSIIGGVKCLASDERQKTRKLVKNGRDPFRVAIVGAGVGGCSSAYFLRKLCGEDIDLHVFEKAVVGGRTDVIQFDGHKYESGGAVMHSSNKYLADFAQQFGTYCACVDIVSLNFRMCTSTYRVTHSAAQRCAFHTSSYF